jgi:predicted O-methyltransferase YrrM
MEVIEFGAGGSTLWLAQRVKHVTSYENDADWLSVLKSKVPDNVTLHFESLPLEGQADLLFLDGEPVELRGEWLRLAPSLLKPGGILVLDNCNRPEYEKELAEFAKTAIHIERVSDTSMGTRYTVTDFYRCKRA